MEGRIGTGKQQITFKYFIIGTKNKFSPRLQKIKLFPQIFTLTHGWRVIEGGLGRTMSKVNVNAKITLHWDVYIYTYRLKYPAV